MEVAFNWIAGLPWLKLAYSVLLLSLSTILVLELVGLWGPQKVYLGTFQYFKDGREEAGLGNGLRTQVSHHHRMLSQRLSEEAERRSAERKLQDASRAVHIAWLPDGSFRFGSDGIRLSDIELTVQGVNLSKLTATLRRAVSDPNEITATVSRNSELIEGVIDWPKAPKRGDGRLRDSSLFPISGSLDDGQAAFQIACSLIWIEAAARAESSLSNITRTEFCIWAEAWTGLFSLRALVDNGAAMKPHDVEILSSVKRTTDKLISRGSEFPEMYKLRADAIDLDPNRSAKDAQQTTADLATYRELLEGKTLAEIAKAQSAPKLTLERVIQAETSLMDVATLSMIAKAASSVGLVRVKDARSEISGTAFVIGINVIATASHVINALSQGQSVATGAESMEFVLTDRIGSADTRVFRVSGIIYDEADQVAILEVPGLHEAGVTSLAIGRMPPDIDTSIVVTGFGGGRDKAFTLGRVLGVSDNNQLFIHDAETSAGSSGSPVFDARTGSVIGVHRGSMPGSDNRLVNTAYVIGPKLFPLGLAERGLVFD